MKRTIRNPESQPLCRLFFFLDLPLRAHSGVMTCQDLIAISSYKLLRWIERENNSETEKSKEYQDFTVKKSRNRKKRIIRGVAREQVRPYVSLPASLPEFVSHPNLKNGESPFSHGNSYLSILF